MLRYKADRRTLAFVGLYFAGVALAYAVDLPILASAVLVIALCLLSFFCAVATHNTVHSPVFKSRGPNRVLQIALSLTYGHPVSMFVPGHNLSHHKYLQTTRDRMRTDKMRYRWNLLNQLFFSFAVGGAIFRNNAEWVQKMRKQRPRWYRQFLVETAFYVGFLLVLLWLDWKKFIFFIVLPHQYAVWGISGINFVQHDGCDADHPHNHSRNFTGWLINWFTFNNGFHGIHHMHPGLHWSLLPEAHAREVAPYVDPRLDQPSLIAYCWKAYIWPGRRMRFDGTPMVLGPPRTDDGWIEGAVRDGHGDGHSDAEYGAVA